MARVPAEAQAFALPKAGHAASEYEDAHAGPVWDAAGAVRLAVADGATESAFAGAWARALTHAWTTAGGGDLRGRARQAFEAEVGRRVEALPWYAQAKAEEGAFATFLGLSVAPDGTWQAEAVGDAVLFHLRDGALAHVWPVLDPAEFGNVPALLGSRAGRSEPEGHRLGATWQPGDAFALTTDALAAYLLQTAPAAVLDVNDADAFARFVETARAGGMRNDDVTLLVLRLR